MKQYLCFTFRSIFRKKKFRITNKIIYIIISRELRIVAYLYSYHPTLSHLYLTYVCESVTQLRGGIEYNGIIRIIVKEIHNNTS